MLSLVLVHSLSLRPEAGWRAHSRQCSVACLVGMAPDLHLYSMGWAEIEKLLVAGQEQSVGSAVGIRGKKHLIIA